MKKDIAAKPLLFPAPVLIVGTYDADGRPNAMNVAWGGICCSLPPCVTISVRKARYTYGSLLETKAFTVNIPGKKHVREADYFGNVSGKTEDKFAVTGLTPIKSEFVNAPYIKEFPVNLECKVVQVLELGSHTQFIGEILNIKVDDTLLDINRPAMIEQIIPLIYDTNSSCYYSLGEKVLKAHSVSKEFLSKPGQ
jgi:flavin reductase (DIM6/NTAB) family NADH-FMN oxidoreductase RutF